MMSLERSGIEAVTVCHMHHAMLEQKRPLTCSRLERKKQARGNIIREMMEDRNICAMNISRKGSTQYVRTLPHYAIWAKAYVSYW